MAKKTTKETRQHSSPKPKENKPAAPPAAPMFTQARILWAILIVYAIAVFYGISNHEPWRDEAQSWLVVKNLDFVGIFKKLPSEGHPPTWYLCLFPLAKLGLPYVSQNILCGLFMVAGVYLLQFRSQLPFLLKLLIPFSYLFFYEYAIVGRSYCLMVFFIGLILWLYPRRFEKPFLFAAAVIALVNSHTLIFSFGFGLTCIYLLDAVHQKKLNAKIWGAFALMVAGSLYIIPYLSSGKVTGAFKPYISTDSLLQSLSLGFLADKDDTLLFVLLGATCLSFITRTKPLLLMIGGMVSVVYILRFVFPGDARHGGTIFLIAIAVYGLYAHYKEDNWNFINEEKLKYLKYHYAAFALAVLMQIKPAFENYMLDKDGLFSDAVYAARYIKENKLEDRIIVGEQAWAASAVLPYLKDHKEMYYIECGRYGSYYVFDTCFTNGHWGQGSDIYVNQAFNTFPRDLNKLLFVLNSPLNQSMSGFVDLLYSTQEPTIKKDESFYIYQFRTK